MFAHERVGVGALGQEQEAYLAPVFHQGQGGFQRTPGSRATGLITIEAEHHFGDAPEQALQVSRAGSGAECGYRIANAHLGQGDDVHVAFH